jgi:hypothetical protein
MRRRRPFGVTVIALVYLANAVVSAWRANLLELRTWRFIDEVGSLDLVQFGVAIVGLALGIGLWQLRPWAWIAAMLWAGVTMVTALLAYYRGEPQFTSMFLSVVAVFYLNSREVQGLFHPDLVSEVVSDD